ncbi:MAG: hypothetical protein ACLURP_10245 [Ruminococcus sp.]
MKQSLDCRHKEDKKFVYTVDVSLQDINQENKILRKVHDNNIMSTKKKEYIFPSPGEEELKYPPVIVGSGPAGIFVPGIWQEQVIGLWFWNGRGSAYPSEDCREFLEKMAYWIRIPMCSLVKVGLVLFPTEN